MKNLLKKLFSKKRDIFKVVANNNNAYKFHVISHKYGSNGEEVVGKIGKNIYSYVYCEVFGNAYFCTTDKATPASLSILSILG